MGGGSWDTSAYKSAAAARASAGIADFDYDRKVKSGRASGVHADLDPKKVAGPASPFAGKNIRESRDNDEHPESIPISVIFDVTGSMRHVPETLQRKLAGLMDVVVAKAGLKDGQILYGAVGDSFSDRYPFQVGQFETDNRSDEQLRNIILEGGGGGGNHESYPLGFYFAARKTVTDAWEKRGKKGYLFTIGDEKSYLKLTRQEVANIFGDQINEDLSIETILVEVAEKWEHFHIIPTNTSYRGDPGVRSFWQNLLGERVVTIEDEALIAEVIAGLVQMIETNRDADAIVKDMGLKGAAGEAVKNALVPVSKGRVPSHVAKGSLPSKRGKGVSGVSRL